MTLDDLELHKFEFLQYFDNNQLLADCNAILDMNSSISAKLPLLQVERPAYN